jgi:hypothetical protein
MPTLSGSEWRVTHHIFPMKDDKFPEDQNQKQMLAGGSRLTAAEDLKQDKIKYALSPDEVARRAYFSYLNQGSSPGHEVRHWLEAEKQMLAERKLA